MNSTKSLLETTKNINKKFLILSIACIVFCFVTLMTSFYTDRLANTKSLLQKNSTLLKESSDYLTNQMTLYALTGDKTHLDLFEKEAYETKGMDIAIANIQKLGTASNEEELITKTMNSFDILIEIETKTTDAVKANNLKTAQDLILGEKYTSEKKNIDNYIISFQDSLITRIDKTIKIAEVFLIAFGIITLALLALILYLFSDYSKFIKLRVIEPITKLKDSFEEISKGNLNTEINIEEDETEIGQFTTVAKNTQVMLKTYIENISESLSKVSNGDISFKIQHDYIGDFNEIKISINNIIDSFNNVISEISNASSQVAASSEEIASSSNVLSNASLEQTSSIEDFSDKINSISESINKNAKASENVKTIIDGAVDEIYFSNTKMKELLSAMGKIDKSSNEISKIIETINNMAFQTNLLAINTAIEAAKAGSNGSQFSVIAEEVRQLADSSAEASKQTKALISESLSAVENGNIIANDTFEVLSEVVEKSKEISTLVSEISNTTQKQADSTTYIVANIDEILQIVQNNSATAEETSALSEELAAQAQVLDQTMNKFKL